MYYLNLDPQNYLLSVSTTPMGDNAPEIETLEGVDLSGVRMNAYRWDGHELVLDGERLAELEQAQEAREKEIWEQQQRDAAMREAQAVLVTAQVDTLAVDDTTALRWKMLYPEWSPEGVEYAVGMKRQRQDKLYRCRQAHTSQASWAPELAPALWEEISETHGGTADDPIPYSGNMALEEGKYYTQDGITYRCTRDTGIPVYDPLAELAGLYVEIV